MPEVNTATSEPTVSPMLKIKIVEQIEYYFGDFNLKKDKFLTQEISKDNGWVSLHTLLKFNRLAALTKHVFDIISAFKENPSQLIEVDDVNNRVRRHPERPAPEQDEAWRAEVSRRTVYVKGFSKETATLDGILKFMQTFGKIDNVFKRSYFDKASKTWKFKGSIYASFPTEEEAKRFVGIKSVKYEGNELIRKMQTDYIEEKKNERLEQKVKNKKLKEEFFQDKRGGKSQEFQKLPTGALLSLSGLTSDIDRNQIKDAVKEIGWDLAFIEYNVGDPIAYLRLHTEGGAKEAYSKLEDGSFKINDVTLKAEVVEGEKEVELLKKMEDGKKSAINQRNNKNSFKRNKGKRFNKKGNSSNGKDEEIEVDDEDKDDQMQSDESDLKKRKPEDELEDENNKKSKPNDE